VSLRPFWRYYGGKWRAAPRYPRPTHDTIIEPFAGAATTGVAALLEGRRFIGMETSAEYFPIACRRLAETEAGADRGSIKRGQGGLFGAA
jgi:hypothetical protein